MSRESHWDQSPFLYLQSSVWAPLLVLRRRCWPSGEWRKVSRWKPRSWEPFTTRTRPRLNNEASNSFIVFWNNGYLTANIGGIYHFYYWKHDISKYFITKSNSWKSFFKSCYEPRKWFYSIQLWRELWFIPKPQWQKFYRIQVNDILYLV